MPRNPGNRQRDIKIYPDANLKFVRMEFTENKKINLKEHAAGVMSQKNNQQSLIFRENSTMNFETPQTQ